MLGPDVVVIEHASFVLRQHDDSSGSISEPLEHRHLLLLSGPEGPHGPVRRAPHTLRRYVSVYVTLLSPQPVPRSLSADRRVVPVSENEAGAGITPSPCPRVCCVFSAQ